MVWSINRTRMYCLPSVSQILQRGPALCGTYRSEYPEYAALLCHRCTVYPSFQLVDELEHKGFSQDSAISSTLYSRSFHDDGNHAYDHGCAETVAWRPKDFTIRIKAFLPLISPVVMSALTATRERAIALEVRGFGVKGTKTWMHPHKKQKQTGFSAGYVSSV